MGIRGAAAHGRNVEVERLGQADRHIATAEQHITKQRLLLNELRADGHDTKTAEQTVKAFEDNLRPCASIGR